MQPHRILEDSPTWQTENYECVHSLGNEPRHIRLSKRTVVLVGHLGGRARVNGNGILKAAVRTPTSSAGHCHPPTPPTHPVQHCALLMIPTFPEGSKVRIGPAWAAL